VPQKRLLSPPKITAEQRRHLALSIARREPNSAPIGRTIGRDLVEEFGFAQNPMGVGGRLSRRLGKLIPARRGRRSKKKGGADGDH
jgi:hypothetical protein